MTYELHLDQLSLDGMCPIATAVETLANTSSGDERGAVFTRREVVDFMLDLMGYTHSRPLHRMRLLEPSFGGGEFLIAAAQRLVAASRSHGAAADLTNCIRGVELHKETFESTQARLFATLVDEGFSPREAGDLCTHWLSSGDFLLSRMDESFDFVVGNPPYVRQELIPAPLLAQYRERYATLYDRADLYVPFIERSLQLLNEGGALCFICADRWTKNKYGGPLRALVTSRFHLKAYVDMVDTPAFSSEVIAYPAITLFERRPAGPTVVAERPEIEAKSLSKLAKAMLKGTPDGTVGVAVIEKAIHGAEPWILTSSQERLLLRRLEARFPVLEEAGCKVGIGVATGADKAFIGLMDTLDVESSRKLPLATTKDIASGSVVWLGKGVINPFEESGQLVDLASYPRLRAYLDAHRDAIAGRHVAKKSPTGWYRTIDRITPALARRPKLLIPDIKGSAHVVYEEGQLYPHHNLYYVTSDEWELRALQAVLLSNVVQHIIAAYSTAMRGGFLRFQAQYLRRVRLPLWKDVPSELRQKLVLAAIERDISACDVAAAQLYELTSEEVELLTRPL